MTSPIAPKGDLVLITGIIIAAATVEANTMDGVALNIHEVAWETTISFFSSRIKS